MLKTKLIVVCLAFCVLPVYGEEGTSMFNGKDLTGWKGRTDLWSVEDGAITGTTSKENPIKKNTFLVWEGGEPGDFELTCKFRISAQGNSGIQYRSRLIDDKEFIVGGYQADIDASLRYAGICYEERGDGILCGRGEKSVVVNDKKGLKKERFADGNELGAKIKKGEWNDYRIVAKGNLLQHYINGELMSQVTDNRDNGKERSNGIIALQIHVGPPMKIQFKEMVLKDLK